MVLNLDPRTFRDDFQILFNKILHFVSAVSDDVNANVDVDTSDYLLSFQRDGAMSDATWAAYSVASKHQVTNP